MRNKIHVCILFIIFAILVGCSEQEKAVNEPLDIQDKQPAEKEEEEQEVIYEKAYPLTGVGTNDDVDQRPFSIMINNHPSARPQSGLDKADLVYEVLAEGFITRYLAIYQSELPDIVGPIRSSRDYYIQLSQGYDSIYVAFGGSEAALQLLDKNVTDYVNGIKYKNGQVSYEDEQFYYRADFRKAPHNVYSTKEKLMEAAQFHNYDVTDTIASLSFRDESEVKETADGTATSATITYSNSNIVRYEYDEDLQSYVRFIGDQQTVDLESERPLVLDNIFIVETKHRVVDNEGRRDIDFTSGGNGYLLQKGHVQKVTWENIDGRILPTHQGEIVPFVVGKTWINVIPTNPGLEEAVQLD